MPSDLTAEELSKLRAGLDVPLDVSIGNWSRQTKERLLDAAEECGRLREEKWNLLNEVTSLRLERHLYEGRAKELDRLRDENAEMFSMAQHLIEICRTTPGMCFCGTHRSDIPDCGEPVDAK